jgi:hypothetical protein
MRTKLLNQNKDTDLNVAKFRKKWDGK